jgi:WXXGXW repeat (2 copies)
MHNRSNRLLSGIFYTTALAFALLLTSPASRAEVGIGVSINIAPPELPVYEQPPVPGPGYLWTPGYWAWGEGDYYWVPGTWVEAPEPGYLWTPGYWGWNDGVYIWNGGYWGPHIGFYGGVNYGYGYIGHGYEGGYWERGEFRYNRAYNNIGGDVHITNVYNRTVIINNPDNRVSFNGGHGGIQARPGSNELAAEHDHHLTPVPAQIQHQDGARGNPELRASQNHGNPPIAATAHAGVFAGQGVMPARDAGAAHPTNFTGTPAHVAPAAPAIGARGGTEASPNASGPPGAAGFAHNGPPLHGTAGTGPAAPPHPMVAAPAHGTAGMGPAGPAAPPHPTVTAPPRGPTGPPATAPHNGPPAASVQRGGGPPPASGHPGGAAPPQHEQRAPPEHDRGDRGDRPH